MSDANDQEQKRPLTLSRPSGRLELRKSVEMGQVRQSFSHGRSKTVTVEVRRKRTIGPALEPGRVEASPIVMLDQGSARPPTQEPARPPVMIPRALTAEEKAGRVRAVHDARKADEEARRRAAVAEADRRRQAEEQAAEEARRHAEEDARRKAEEEEKRRRAEEEARQRSEQEAQRRKDEESRREVAERAGKAAAAKVAALAAAGKVSIPLEEEEEEPSTVARRGTRPEAKKPVAPARRQEIRRRTGKMTVTRALADDEGERVRSLASVRRARERERQRLHQGEQEQIKVVRDVVVPETITVQEVANRMA